MNNIPNKTSDQFCQNRPLGIFNTLIFSTLAILLTIASGKLALSMTLTALAGAVFAFLLLSLKRKALIFIPTILAFASLYLMNTGFIRSAVCAVCPIIVATAVFHCIKNRKKFFTCIGITSVAITAVILITFAANLYCVYGSVLTGFNTYITEVKNEMTNAILQIFDVVRENYKLEYGMSEADITSFLRQVAVIIPSFVILSAEILSATAYFSTYMFLKNKKRKQYFFNTRLDFTISFPTSLFFVISGIFALIFSMSTSTLLIFYAFVNICIILFLPMFIRGIIALVTSFKQPKSIDAPNGRSSGILTAVLLVFLTLFNPVLALFFLAYHGACSTVRLAIAEYIKNKKDEYDN